MKTAVIMKRKLFDNEISQNSKNEMFSATDLVRAGNLWRLQNGLEAFNLNSFFATKSSIEFIASLEEKYGVVKIASRGKNQHTWVHPLLFIDIALSISPKLKIEVYEWLYDNLLKYRNDSGDSYKKMTGALWERFTNKQKFVNYLYDVAEQIQKACHVTDWQHASPEQLKKRDKIHENITLLTSVLKNPNDAVRIGIEKVGD